MRYQAVITKQLTRFILCLSVINISQADTTTVNNLLESYKTQGAISTDIKQGESLWKQEFMGKGDFTRRSCTTCHTDDLTRLGKHIKTSKEIKPMSPSINPQRLSNFKKVEKWFKRNCKWTIGRECTAQEKSNILSYIENRSKF